MAFGTPSAKFNITAEDKTARAFKSAKFQMNSLSKSAKGLGLSMGGLIGAGSLVGLAGNALNAADEIDNLAKQMDLGLETTQSLKVIADESGISLGSLTAIINKLSGSQAKAITEGGKLEDSFNALGISVEDLKTLNTEELLERVSVALRDGGDSAAVQSAALVVMGDRSKKVNTVITQLADGIDGLNKLLIEQGRIMSEETVHDLDKMEERWTRMKQRLGVRAAEAMVITGGGAMMGTDYLTEFLKGGGMVGAVEKTLEKSGAYTMEETNGILFDIRSGVVELVTELRNAALTVFR